MNNRWWVAAVVVVASVTGVAGEPASVDALGETGRITLTPVTRILDTRGGLPVSAAVNYGLPPGLLTVVAKPRADGAGEADVFPCVGSPDTEPTFHFDDGGTVTRSIVVPLDVAFCLRSNVAVDLVIDRRGQVNGAPSIGGLQYEPLLTPELVVESEFTSTTIPIPRGASLPASAEGATYSIDLFGDTSSYAILHPCGQPPALAADISVTNDGHGLAIVNMALESGQQACVTLVGSGYVEVTLLGALNTTGPDPTRLPPQTTSRLGSVAPPGFAPITPDRAFDTRTDGGGKLLPTEVFEVDLNDYLTPWSTAVVMNVTVTGAEAEGFLTVWPCDEPQPNASNLNFQAGVDVPNLVTVRLAIDGTVCINGSATTHVLGDISGTYEFGDGVGSTPISPVRIMDTRAGFGAQIVGANGIIQLQVAGRAGIPASGVEAVTMNVTVTGSQDDGYLTAWPCDQPQPNASNLNFRRGVDVPNLVTVKLAANGTVCFFSTATTHVLADAAMFYSAASTGGFIDLVPKRILDTRVPIGQPTVRKFGEDPSRPRSLCPNLPLCPGSVPMTLVARNEPMTSIPAGALSVTMNVTIAEPEGAGYLTVWPCDEPRPGSSNLNFQSGMNVPNLVSVKLGIGSLCFSSTERTHILADVAGYTTDVPVSYWDVVIV